MSPYAARVRPPPASLVEISNAKSCAMVFYVMQHSFARAATASARLCSIVCGVSVILQRWQMGVPLGP